ncbi:hypothetical protein QZH56_01780 [Streptomyces olivoreticuli]|uniref:hypothetical protein n=1 Tax=Streptomyces olivoreticuli TaxID=68246 RepID=UPI0026595391|nr:hypothetical protein [Streptomyces olivoreticuli]WKK24409.1 hypothetical protein QZH56_01780 [Streptomyces olivoreticuli]
MSLVPVGKSLHRLALPGGQAQHTAQPQGLRAQDLEVRHAAHDGAGCSTGVTPESA